MGTAFPPQGLGVDGTQRSHPGRLPALHPPGLILEGQLVVGWRGVGVGERGVRWRRLWGWCCGRTNRDGIHL